MAQSARRLFTPPRLRLPRGEDEAPRHSTWLETFYDLIFAVAVTALGGRLSGKLTWSSLIIFLALFLPVWWAWLGHSVYDTRFDTDDVTQRLLTFAIMLAAALMAVFIPTAVAAGSFGFAAAYVIARATLLALYLRAHRSVKASRPITRLYLIGFGVGAGCWAISLLTPIPVRFILWGVGLAIDFATPWLGQPILRRAPVDTAHLPERLGLFTIIVLGETITGVVAGIAAHSGGGVVQMAALAAGALAFVLALCLWWVYFLFVDAAPFADNLSSGQPYMYVHLPIYIAITLIGAGMARAVEEAPHVSLDTPTILLLCGGLALWLMALLALKLVSLRRKPSRQALRYVVSVLLIGALALVARDLEPLLVIGALTGITVIFTALEALEWTPPPEGAEVESNATQDT